MRYSCLRAVPFLLLAACAEPPTPESVPDDFGLAVRHNIEAQIAAPDREVEELGAAPGARRALTVERYQTDQVDPPIEIYTRDE